MTWSLPRRAFLRLRRFARAHLDKERTACLYDVVMQKEPHSSLTKRALLSYVVYPFLISDSDPRIHHGPTWRVQEIVRQLNALGYSVDVISRKNTTFAPRRHYDLFLCHGAVNFQQIARRLPHSIPKIFFASAAYWRFHNEQHLARVEALSERKGVTLQPDRLIKRDQEGALRMADGIIGIGNNYTASTYSDFSPVIMLDNAVAYDSRYDRVQKDFHEGRRNFLYFAGAGGIHKGLDLALDAFSQLEGQHLWICGRISDEFVALYYGELHNRPNIHLVGWAVPRSAEFYEVADRCSYAILPSASEGTAHSIIECMMQGLIPVVTRASGVTVDGFGFVLEPCSVQEIKRVVQYCSSLDLSQCSEMSSRAHMTAATRHSRERFARSFSAAVKQVIAHAEETRAAVAKGSTKEL